MLVGRNPFGHRQAVLGDGINLSFSLCFKLRFGVQALLDTSIYMDCDLFCFEQPTRGGGAVDLQSLLPALAVEVCLRASDAKRLAPLLQ